MAKIEPALPSPRLVGNVLKWYYGDTFSINWTITLKRDGVPIIFGEGDQIVFSFYIPNSPKCVQVFTFDNITSNLFTLNFTSDISKKFIPGKYVYDIKYISTAADTMEVKTIGSFNCIEVERCH